MATDFGNTDSIEQELIKPKSRASASTKKNKHQPMYLSPNGQNEQEELGYYSEGKEPDGDEASNFKSMSA